MNLNNLKPKEILPGFYGKIIHGEKMSWILWDIKKGSKLPEHHHVNEQSMYVIKGELEFTLNGKTSICGPGTVIVIPSNQVHSGISKTSCQILDVFSPTREDYK